MKISLFILILFLYLPVYPQGTGSISGFVYDAQDSTPINGAVAMVKNLQGAITDSTGRFIIIKIPPGSYNLIISYIGYKTKIITGISVNENERTELDKPVFMEFLPPVQDSIDNWDNLFQLPSLGYVYFNKKPNHHPLEKYALKWIFPDYGNLWSYFNYSFMKMYK